jgi:hypothetical protein
MSQAWCRGRSCRKMPFGTLSPPTTSAAARMLARRRISSGIPRRRLCSRPTRFLRARRIGGLGGGFRFCREIVDLGYPARREIFLVAVEREEAELSDTFGVLAPALPGVTTFPCSPLRSSSNACSTTLENVTLAQGVEAFVSSIFFTTHSWRSIGKETFCVLIFITQKN